MTLRTLELLLLNMRIVLFLTFLNVFFSYAIKTSQLFFSTVCVTRGRSQQCLLGHVEGLHHVCAAERVQQVTSPSLSLMLSRQSDSLLHAMCSDGVLFEVAMKEPFKNRAD